MDRMFHLFHFCASRLTARRSARSAGKKIPIAQYKADSSHGVGANVRARPTQRWSAAPDRPGGFTLIELMVAIAVLATLLGMAVPAFSDMMGSNRARTATDDLVTALELARSEAIKLRRVVVVCKRAGDGCAQAADWASGWLVTSNGSVIKAWDGPGGDLTLSGPTNGVTFRSTGLPDSTADFAVGFKCGDDGQQRTITISATGRVHTSRGSC